MLDQGLDPAGYQDLPPAEKAKIKDEANVRHKTVRRLHAELKNDLFRLEHAIEQGQSLFDRVLNSQPDELDAIKKQVAADGDKIVSRFFTYAMRIHNEKADKDKAVKNLESTIEKLGEAKAQIEREFLLYHEKRQRQLQAQYGVSADQDFANITADNALLVIKKEELQREIEALELEKRQRLGQDASVSEIGPLETSNPAAKVRTVVVDRGRQGPSLRM